jgi:hypothetical protein
MYLKDIFKGLLSVLKSENKEKLEEAVVKLVIASKDPAKLNIIAKEGGILLLHDTLKNMVRITLRSLQFTTSFLCSPIHLLSVSQHNTKFSLTLTLFLSNFEGVISLKSNSKHTFHQFFLLT